MDKTFAASSCSWIWVVPPFEIVYVRIWIISPSQLVLESSYCINMLLVILLDCGAHICRVCIDSIGPHLWGIFYNHFYTRWVNSEIQDSREEILTSFTLLGVSRAVLNYCEVDAIIDINSLASQGILFTVTPPLVASSIFLYERSSPSHKLWMSNCSDMSRCKQLAHNLFNLSQ